MEQVGQNPSNDQSVPLIPNEDFGSLLKRLRKSWHMTQDQLADVLICSTSYIGHMEQGKRLPSLEMAVALATTFGYVTRPAHELRAFLSLALDAPAFALLPTETCDSVQSAELEKRMHTVIGRWLRQNAA